MEHKDVQWTKAADRHLTRKQFEEVVHGNLG